jgi:hypothetical protein
MDDLEGVPVRVKYIGGGVSQIVFQPCPRGNIAPGASEYCRPVEFIDGCRLKAFSGPWRDTKSLTNG